MIKNKLGDAILLDSFGYLKSMTDWDEYVARQLAEKENIVLTEDHWEIIFFVRNFYNEYKTSPAMRMLSKAIEKKLGKDKAKSIYLFQLFPQGPATQATKIAGLPKPAKCL